MQDKTKRPTVSVIMNCRNGSRYLREAIDSVFAQTYPDWEIVFWDNGSTDDSWAIAQSYGPRVACWKTGDSVSLGRARNRAMEKAQGTYVAFLDCDDVWLPEKLERQLPLFDRGQVGLVYCDATYFDATGFAATQHGKRRPPIGMVFESLLFGNFITMSTAVVRRTAFERLDHGFDPQFEVAEEADLFLRIAHDWEVGYAPAALCRYRIHDGNLSVTQPDACPYEHELLIEKLRNMYPEFAAKYYDRMTTEIAVEYAQVEWKQGSRREARRRLRQVASLDRRWLLYYMGAFFPYSVIRVLRKHLSRRAFITKK